MKKSDYRGWKDVFCFSFMQGIKQKAYVGFIVFVAVVVLAAPFVLKLFEGDGENTIDVTVEKLVVFDEVGLPIDYSKAFAGSICEDVKVEVSVQPDSAAFDSYVEGYVEAEDLKEMALRISFEETGLFSLKFVKGAKADLSGDECDAVVEAFDAFFTTEKLSAIDVSEEQYAFINQSVNTEVLFTDETGATIEEEEEAAEGISEEAYFVLLGGIMVCTMLISLSGGSIASSIVTEKSTRVVEYLMINVRPLALIVGKILSALLLTLIQFAVAVVGVLLSNGLQQAVFGAEAGNSLTDMMSFMTVFEGISVVNLILAVLIIFMGIMFFGILAGLAGASVSKMEELAEGLKIYNMLMIIGAYVGIAICIMETMGGVDPMIINVCSLIPITTPFIVPAALLMGRCTTVIAVIGLILLVLLTIALYLFTANVYESLIFYNGKVLKTKDILQIAKTRRKGDA